MGAGGGECATRRWVNDTPAYKSQYDFIGANLVLMRYVDFLKDISSDAIALSLDIPFTSPKINWEDDGLTTTDYFGSTGKI